MTIKTERQLIDTVQRGLVLAENALAKLSKVNREAGRTKEGEIANGFYHKLHVLHHEMSMALMESYPDFATDVLTRGPGR